MKLSDAIHELTFRFSGKEFTPNHNDKKALNTLINYVNDFTFIKGMELPLCVDIEEVVIGALLMDSNSVKELPYILPEHFFDEKNKLIFKCLKEMLEQKLPIDILTASKYISKKGLSKAIGGDYQLIKLMKKVYSSSHINYHCFLIVQFYLLRRIIELGNTITKMAYIQDDIFDIEEKIKDFLEEMQIITDKMKNNENN